MKQLAKVGPVFNSAYIVTGEKATDKIDSVFDTFVGQLVRNPPVLDPNSIERSVRVLQRERGIGSFMAGQIVADLRWCMSGGWYDKNEWAAMGPGSKRGMNRLLGRPVDAAMLQPEFAGHLLVYMHGLKSLLPPAIVERLEAIDYQNCLCEYDKYCRVLDGAGRPKSKFKPNPSVMP